MSFNLSEAFDLIEKFGEDSQTDRQPVELYEPRNYIMSLGGKKLRSLLCLMGYHLYQPDFATALPMAYCLELFHNFTLVHDDIMDEADKRRGQPSVHARYDENVAILSGDVMLIEVYDRLSDLDLPDPLQYIRVFNRTARKVCEGQSMDMTFETTDRVGIEDYLKMIELKTAVLIGLSLQSGALMAGASKKDQYHLYNFGCNAGIAFQLQDDFLDVYGKAADFGKKVGGDIIQGKKSYLFLRAVGLLEENERDEFKALYTSKSIDPGEKVKRVTRIFDDLYIPNYCHEAKNSFFDLAKSHMDAVQADENKKSELIEFARSLFNRDK